MGVAVDVPTVTVASIVISTYGPLVQRLAIGNGTKVVLKRKGRPAITMAFHNWHVDDIGGVDQHISDFLSTWSRDVGGIAPGDGGGWITAVVPCIVVTVLGIEEPHTRVQASIPESVSGKSSIADRAWSVPADSGIIDPDVTVVQRGVGKLKATDQGVDRMDQSVNFQLEFLTRGQAAISVKAVVEIDFDGDGFL